MVNSKQQQFLDLFPRSIL